MATAGVVHVRCRIPFLSASFSRGRTLPPLAELTTIRLLAAQGRESQFTDQLLFNWRNTFWGANLKLAQLQVGGPE